MSEYSQLIQMITALTNRLNVIEINGKKIDELNQLSTLNPSSKIHVSVGGQSFYVEVSQLIDAISNANHDHIVSISADITVVDNQVTVPTLIWLLGNVLYQTTTDTVFTIPYCADGLNRKDIFVLNNNNEVVRIAGPEDADIVVRPNVPIGTLLLTEISVSDSVVGTPTDPTFGIQFKTKVESSDAPYMSMGSAEYITGTEASYARIIGQDTGFLKAISVAVGNAYVYPGKEYTIKNERATALIIKHQDTTIAGANYKKFWFYNEQDLVLQPGESATFRFSQGRFELICTNRIASSTPQNYTVIAKNVVDSASVTGTTANTIIETFVIPANTFQPGDVIVFRQGNTKTGTAGALSNRTAIGSWNAFFQQSSANAYGRCERYLVVKEPTVTQELSLSTNTFTSNIQSALVTNHNIDWTIAQNLEIRVQLGNSSDSVVVSFWELSRIR